MLKNFLGLVAQHDFMERARVIQVVTAKPQPLFVARYIDRLKGMLPVQVIACDIAALKKAQLQAQLEMSFLGTRSVYVLYVGGDTGKYDQSLIEYVHSYGGEHTIIIFTLPDVVINAQLHGMPYVLEESVTAPLYHELYRFLWAEECKDQRFVQYVCKDTSTLSLDMACMLMQYHLLLGRNTDLFFTQWVDRIFVRKQSLFLLAQQLFAQDASLFYHTWNTVAGTYPAEFWIAYWSEQVWQAITFVSIARKQGPLAAKKSVSRLPFSFINKDWRLYDEKQLMKAYDLLYTFDYALKHGSNSELFELFFAQFLPLKKRMLGI